MALLSYVAGHSQAGGEAAGGVVGVFGGLVIRVGNYVIDVVFDGHRCAVPRIKPGRLSSPFGSMDLNPQPVESSSRLIIRAASLRVSTVAGRVYAERHKLAGNPSASGSGGCAMAWIS